MESVENPRKMEILSGSRRFFVFGGMVVFRSFFAFFGVFHVFFRDFLQVFVPFWLSPCFCVLPFSGNVDFLVLLPRFIEKRRIFALEKRRLFHSGFSALPLISRFFGIFAWIIQNLSFSTGLSKGFSAPFGWGKLFKRGCGGSGCNRLWKTVGCGFLSPFRRALRPMCGIFLRIFQKFSEKS